MAEDIAGDVEVADNQEASRFEATVGGRLAGFAEYKLHGDRLVLPHTEVDDAFEGRGVGGRLARAALDSAREAGLTVVPLCPFVAHYIQRHPDYADLVADEHRDAVRPGADS